MTRNLIFSFIKIAENIREMKRYLILKMANIYLEKWRELSRKNVRNYLEKGRAIFIKMAGNIIKWREILPGHRISCIIKKVSIMNGLIILID